MPKVQHLVVDSGAFIKNAPLHAYSENIYTVDGAVKEIKDKATLQRLQFLPYSLKVKEPSPEAYKHVVEFSKKTGDFSSLSAVDLHIIALTYQLEKENVGTDHLNQEPSCKVTGKPCFVDLKLSGFYYPKKASKDRECQSSDISEDKKECDDLNSKDENSETETSIDNKENEMDENASDKSETETSIDNKENEMDENASDKSETETSIDNKENEVDENASDNSEDEESNDEEGWITSENITEMQRQMGGMSFQEDSEITVACISTDFSVQNVLLQMGLRVLSVDGMLIRNTRVFILRCYACFKTTNNTSKQFCPNCGNKTLKRVAVSCGENGSKNIHINFRKPINIRGTRYSLPMPKGGKHADNPIICEDQPIPHNRPPKMAMKKIDVLSPDYEALSSPFATNDIYSRAASLGIRTNKTRNQKKNPNEWSKRTGNKKKK